METTKPEPETGRNLNDALKLAVSSGLIAAAVALFGSLFGLLYRVGWLETFGLPSELFLPESATELSLWAYMAALGTWSFANKTLEDQWLALLSATLAFVLTVTLLALAARKLQLMSQQWEARVEAVRTNFWGRLTEAFLSVAAPLIAAPWIAIGATALLVSAPLPGFYAGKRQAETAIRAYRASLTTNIPSCHTLTSSGNKVGQCPFVVVQMKERIAFLDGDQLRIIPAVGGEFNKPLRKQPNG